MSNEEKWLNQLSKKQGYYELNIKYLEELIDLIRPDAVHLRTLMTDLKFQDDPGENIDIPKFGSIGPLRPQINDEIIFRGQARSEWSLTPSYYRNQKFYSILNDPRNLVKDEYLSLMNFQKTCDLSGVQIPADSLTRRNKQKEIIDEFSKNHSQDFWHDEFAEVGAFAQHFGVETSLLDWSRNILTSCYFASIEAMKHYLSQPKDKRDRHDCLSIWVLNNQHLDCKYVKTIEPPKSLNNHIAYQQGVLTVTKIDSNIIPNAPGRSIPNNSFSMEQTLSHFNKSHLLLKISIPLFNAADLYQYCDAFNFNASSLFKGVQGAVQHIKNDALLEKFISCLADESDEERLDES